MSKRKAATKRKEAQPAAAPAAAPVVNPFVEAFSRAWWFLFVDYVNRYQPAVLGDHRSVAAITLRHRVELALNRAGFKVPIGWKVEPADREKIEEQAKAFVLVGVRTPECEAWVQWFAARQVIMPIPDQAQFVWMPSLWPGDEREQLDAGELEGEREDEVEAST